MDAACYSFLQRCKVDWFKPNSKNKSVSKLPALPFVFDGHKGRVLAHLEEEKKRLKALEEGKSEEEKK